MGQAATREPPARGCILAVGGGKGGTGKSVLAANLGIALAQLRQRVILVDLDLGGANLHTCLGIRSPRRTLGDALQQNGRSIQEMVEETGVERLELITGSNDPLEIANLPYGRKLRLIRQLKGLRADYVILDLGAGTHLNVLDFFLCADYGIAVSAPEPTALENTSRFIKCVLMRRLKILLKQQPAANLKDRIKDPRNREAVRTFWDLLRLIRAFDETSADRIEEGIQTLRFGLVLNKLREHAETRMAAAYQSMIRRCLGVRMETLAQIFHDDKVPAAVKAFRPLLLEYPHARAAQAIRLLAKRILGLGLLAEEAAPLPPLFGRSKAPVRPQAAAVEGGVPRLRFYL